jgi:hypothetical protein
MTFFGKCRECNEVSEVHIPWWYDGPSFCPECRSIDCFDEVEEEELNA